MAYIPNSYAPPASSGKRALLYQIPAGGVKFGDTKMASGESKCAYISNLDLRSDAVATRKSLTALMNMSGISGELHSISKQPFYDRLVMHIGNSLYSCSMNDEAPVLISGELFDSKSVMCEFMSKLYIYCNTHIYSLDNSFTLTEEEPKAALMFEEVSVFDGLSIEITYPNFNIMSSRIRVDFRSTTVKTVMLPRLCDTTRKVETYINSEPIDVSKCKVFENKVSFPDEAGGHKYSVVYYVKNPEDIGFDDTLYDCNCICAFGGDITGGTRLFFTGNENKKGYYYKSPLQDPLYAGSEEYEIIGDGCENITAIVKMYGDLMLFSDNSVFKMGYTLSESGSFFSIKELNSGIGCDCPESIQLIDNRVVFANSEKGIFIVDSSEETGEQNIKPIGGNILKGQNDGFLDNGKLQLKNAKSIDFDRKYMLFVSDRVYIWDYDMGAFSDSGNYSKAQSRLVWYMYKGIEADALFEMDSKLIILDKKSMTFYGFEEGGGMNDVDYRFRCCPVEFGMGAVFVTDMEMLLESRCGRDVVLSLYGDGEKYFETRLEASGTKLKTVKLKLPKRKLYNFEFELSGTGNIEFKGLTLKYIQLSK